MQARTQRHNFAPLLCVRLPRPPIHPPTHPPSLPPCTHAGLQLLGHVDEQFVEVVDVFEPLEDGSRDKAFISKVCVCGGG